MGRKCDEKRRAGVVECGGGARRGLGRAVSERKRPLGNVEAAPGRVVARGC